MYHKISLRLLLLDVLYVLVKQSFNWYSVLLHIMRIMFTFIVFLEISCMRIHLTAYFADILAIFLYVFQMLLLNSTMPLSYMPVLVEGRGELF